MHQFFRLSALLVTCATHCLAAEPMPAFTDLPESKELPDPLVMLDGTPVKNTEIWEKSAVRRSVAFSSTTCSAKRQLHRTTSHSKSTKRKNYFGGKATLKEVTTKFGPESAPPIHLLVITPITGKPSPVFGGLNFSGNHTTLADIKIHLTNT